MSDCLAASRVVAWTGLLKVYGALRWGDARRLSSQNVALRESGPAGRLTRTKTSVLGTSLRELPVFVPNGAYLVSEMRLRDGYSLRASIGQGPRDYFLPRSLCDNSWFTNRVATSAEAECMSTAMLRAASTAQAGHGQPQASRSWGSDWSMGGQTTVEGQRFFHHEVSLAEEVLGARP